MDGLDVNKLTRLVTCIEWFWCAIYIYFGANLKNAVPHWTKLSLLCIEKRGSIKSSFFINPESYEKGIVWCQISAFGAVNEISFNSSEFLFGRTTYSLVILMCWCNHNSNVLMQPCSCINASTKLITFIKWCGLTTRSRAFVSGMVNWPAPICSAWKDEYDVKCNPSSLWLDFVQVEITITFLSASFLAILNWALFLFFWLDFMRFKHSKRFSKTCSTWELLGKKTLSSVP